MKKEGYYSSGEFASMAQVTLRTIRYYDKINLLKPSFITEKGARFYNDEDLVKLQQILLFKYLGFSLEEISELIVDDADPDMLLNSLSVQKKLIQNRIEQMQLVEQAIQKTTDAMKQNHRVNWQNMLHLIHLTGVEKGLKNQYQDASNISARIQLHNKYSTNPLGWFRWIFQKANIHSGMSVFEIGCGDGTLWKKNINYLPEHLRVTLLDSSEGMVSEAKRNINLPCFSFYVESAEQFQFTEKYDRILANHVLFYLDDLDKVLAGISRYLKPGGIFLCSTYGKKHMKEITELVRQFDERIVLSSEILTDRFGKENGEKILQRSFSTVSWYEYADSLFVDNAEALISYILSCHGNQKEYILPRYKEFSTFVRRKTLSGFTITKDAGIFIAKK